jgi:uncharacterized protein (TIGR03435 family)
VRRLMKASVVLFATITIRTSVVRLLGQAAQPSAGKETFEVASVKPNSDTNIAPNIQLQPGGRVTITRFPLFQLIWTVYASDSIQLGSQIVGGPSWIKSERFDVVAKADDSLEPDDAGKPTRLLAMLRSLVEERFHLQVHTETREMSVYLLVLEDKNGKPGPQLHPSSYDCRGLIATPSAPADATRWCGARTGASGHIQMQGLTMPQMTTIFANNWIVGRPVLNRTGLSGRWDGSLEFVPAFLPGPNPDSAPVENPAADSGPNLLSAIKEQLGLRLEPAKAPVEVLVIDHAERPTPD